VTVELNSGDNGNRWVAVKVIGSHGIAANGRSNRDGIGATISFTPHHGNTVMAPVLGGSSHLSQHSLTQTFGLGRAWFGTVDILWPGGTRNRVYNVFQGQTLEIPELPCSYDTTDNFRTYRQCVGDGLRDLHQAGVIDGAMSAKMWVGAIRAYLESR